MNTGDPTFSASRGANSQSAEDYIQLAWEYYVQQEYNKALETFTQALQLDKRLVDGHYGSALTLRAQGKTNEALDAFKNAQAVVNDETLPIDTARRTIYRQLIETQITLTN